MEATAVKIPKTLNAYVKENLGFDLKELLGKKKNQTLKKDLKALISLITEERHYAVKAPVTFKAGTEIIIKGSDNGFDFQPLGYRNRIAFELSALKFNLDKDLSGYAREHRQSFFYTDLEAFVKALK